MPVFTSIGVALGVTAASVAAGGMTAFAAGAVAVGAAAAAIGTPMYSSAKAATAQGKAMASMLAANTPAQIADVGRIAPEEAQETTSKRLARVGRFFTSPLGDVTGASTGSQRIFS